MSTRLAITSSCAAVFFGGAVSKVAADESAEPRRTYNLPRGDASTTLRQFAGLLGRQVLFLSDKVQGEQTNALTGNYTPREALDRMLANTNLVAIEDEATGGFVVSRRPAPVSPGEVGHDKPQPKKDPMNTSTSRSKLRTWLAHLALAATTLATAQQTQERSSSNDKEEAVVLSPFTVSATSETGYQTTDSTSATRFRVSLLDTPFSVTIIPRELLDDVAAVDIRDALKYTAGAQNSGPGSYVGSSQNLAYRIRGFVSPTVLLDGFPTSIGAGITPTVLENIELVKGPSSMLYGAVPPGGVINAVLKRPFLRSQSELKFTLASWEDYSTSIDVNGLINDTNAFRLNAFWRDADDYSDNTHRRALELFPSVKLRPFGKNGGELFLQASHQSYFENGQPMGPLWAKRVDSTGLTTNTIADGYNWYDILPSDNPTRPAAAFTDTKIDSLLADYTHNINDTWHYRAAAYYNRQKTLWNVADVSLIVSDVPNDPSNFFADRFVFFLGAPVKSEYTGGQLNLLGKWNKGADSEFNLLLGADGNMTKSGYALNTVNRFDQTVNFSKRETWSYAFPSPEQFNVVLAEAQSKAKSYGVYAVGHLSTLQKRLNGMFGLRQTHTENVTHNLSDGSKQDLSSSRLTFQSGLTYKLSNHLAVYANYSSSFVPQDRILFGPKDPVTGVKPAFAADPLVGKGGELGIKRTFFNGRVMASVDVFHLDMENVIDEHSSQDPVTGVITDSWSVQNGKQGSRGVEVSFSGQITQSWSMFLNYTNATGHDFAKADDPRDPFKGLSEFPRNDFGVLTKYEFGKTGNKFLKGLVIGSGFKYRDSTVSGSNPQLPEMTVQRSYHVVDAFASYTFGERDEYSIQFNARNLGNALYVSNDLLLGTPRSYVVSITWRQ